MLRKFSGIVTAAALTVFLTGCGDSETAELEKESEAHQRPVKADAPPPAVPGKNTQIKQGGSASESPSKPAGTSSSGGN